MREAIFYVHNMYGHIRTCWGYYDLGDFVVKVGSWSFGNSFHDKRWSLKTRNYSFGYCRSYLREEGEEELLTVKYLVYDEEYNIVPCKELDKLYTEAAHRHNIYPVRRSKYKWRWHYMPDNYPGFRNGPVPGTGRGRGYSYHRAPRTTHERRWSLADKEYTRPKRNFRMLPDTWDDIPRSDARIKRSWKKQKKKKQWM